MVGVVAGLLRRPGLSRGLVFGHADPPDIFGGAGVPVGVERTGEDRGRLPTLQDRSFERLKADPAQGRSLDPDPLDLVALPAGVDLVVDVDHGIRVDRDELDRTIHADDKYDRTLLVLIPLDWSENAFGTPDTHFSTFCG